MKNFFVNLMTYYKIKGNKNLDYIVNVIKLEISY